MDPKKLLVVSAHGADWCTRSGGTLIRYHNAGWAVHILALTYGERGESPDYWVKNPDSTLAACKACRRREAQAAADFLGFSIEFLDYDDYPLIMDAPRISDLTARILALRPHVVLTHNATDPFNVDHEEAARATIRAVSAAAMIGQAPNTPAHFVPDLFLFEASLPQSEFNDFKPDTYVDVSDVMDKKLAAISNFRCQPYLPDYYTRCGAKRGEQATNWLRGRGTVKFAEGFKRYTPYVGVSLPLIDFSAG